MFVADLSLLFWYCWTKADSRPANEQNITLSLSSVIPEPQPGMMKAWKHDRDRDTQNLGFSDSLSRVAKLQYPERSACLWYTVKQRGLTWARLSHSHGDDLTCPRQSIIITQDFRVRVSSAPQRLPVRFSNFSGKYTVWRKERTMSETESCQVSCAAVRCSVQFLKRVHHLLFPSCVESQGGTAGL